VPNCQRALVQGHSNLGWLNAHQKQFPAAYGNLDLAVAQGQKLVSSHPTRTDYANDLGYSLAYRGWARVRTSQSAEAAADLRRALELWSKDKPPDLEPRFEGARALALLAGLGADVKSGISADEAAALADQAVAALQAAIQAGWANRNELKEPD